MDPRGAVRARGRWVVEEEISADRADPATPMARPSDRGGGADGVRSAEGRHRGGRPAAAPARLVAPGPRLPGIGQRDARRPAARPRGGPGGHCSWSAGHIDRLTYRLFEPARILTTPLIALLNPRSRWLTMLHAMLGVAWLFVVWGLCGGAIARIAVVQEAQVRQPGIVESVRFAGDPPPRSSSRRCCPLLAFAFCYPGGTGLRPDLPAARPATPSPVPCSSSRWRPGW